MTQQDPAARSNRGARSGVLWAALLASLLIAVPTSAQATVYKWVDENGVTHYSTDPERIPKRLRGGWRRAPEPETQVETDAPSEDLSAIPAPRTRPGSLGTELWAIPGPRSRASRPRTKARPSISERVPRGDGPPPAAPGEILPAVDAASTAAPALPSVPASPATELETQVERDREALKDLVSRPAADRTEWIQDPRLREIAKRLPKAQEELEAVRRDPGD